MITPATHKRDVGGRMNSTNANTTNATNTPVRRIGLLPVDCPVFAAKVCSQEHDKRTRKVCEVNAEDVEVFHSTFLVFPLWFASASRMTACAIASYPTCNGCCSIRQENTPDGYRTLCTV